MTTYREAIYMCLDLVKGNNDDFSYTEEHIAYLLDKYRALFLKTTYGNDPKKHIPYNNYQTITIKLKDGKSTSAIPNLLQLGIPRITTEDYYNIEFEFVNRERLPFVGNNKYLSNIRYCGLTEDNKLKVKLKDTDKITEVKLTAIFEEPRTVYSSTTDHWLDLEIPLEEALVSTLIETVVKVLTSAIYKPDDDVNDNRDDLAVLHTFLTKNLKSDLAKQLS